MSQHLNGHLQNVGNLADPSSVSHLAAAAAASTSLSGLGVLPFSHQQGSISNATGNLLQSGLINIIKKNLKKNCF